MLPNQIDGIAHGEMPGLTATLQLFSMAFAAGRLHVFWTCSLAYHALMSQFLVVCFVISLVTFSAGKIMGAVCLYFAMACLATRIWR